MPENDRKLPVVLVPADKLELRNIIRISRTCPALLRPEILDAIPANMPWECCPAPVNLLPKQKRDRTAVHMLPRGLMRLVRVTRERHPRARPSHRMDRTARKTSMTKVIVLRQRRACDV
jgi:hypothetical protein